MKTLTRNFVAEDHTLARLPNIHLMLTVFLKFMTQMIPLYLRFLISLILVFNFFAAARALRGAKAKTNFGVDSGPKAASPMTTSSSLPMAYLPWTSSRFSSAAFHPTRTSTGSATVLHVNLGTESKSRASEFMSHPPMKGVPILQVMQAGLGPKECNIRHDGGTAAISPLPELDLNLGFRRSSPQSCSSLESTQESTPSTFQFSPDHSVISATSGLQYSSPGFSSDSPTLTSSPWQ